MAVIQPGQMLSASMKLQTTAATLPLSPCPVASVLSLLLVLTVLLVQQVEPWL